MSGRREPMFEKLETQEFEELLRTAAIQVPPDELPAMREQYLLVKRYVAIVEAAVADLGELEPGFRFDAQWGKPA
jgi:hypothetical protein